MASGDEEILMKLIDLDSVDSEDEEESVKI